MEAFEEGDPYCSIYVLIYIRKNCSKGKKTIDWYCAASVHFYLRLYGQHVKIPPI